MGTIANDVLRPVLFDAENQKQPERARRTFHAWLMLVLLGGAFILAVITVSGNWIAELLLAEAYRDNAVEIMIWVGSGYAVFAVIQSLENRLLSLGHSGRLVLPQGIGAIGNIVLSIVLISRNGVVGAAQASALSFVAQLLVTGVVLRRSSRRKAVCAP
jgi:O-antigen/teichoic acid export membrane protein